jgi:hypothetical protein
MASPTSVTCAVDSTEYSRYENGRNTITATITVQGGAPYTAEPVYVELRKARRGRDAVVAVAPIEFTGSSDPQEAIVEFYLPDIVDQDLINLVRYGKYFVHAYAPAKSATATIGSGVNGTINLVADAGAAGNSWTIEVVVPAGTSQLYADYTGTAITVHLAVNGGVPTVDNNTALVLNAINAISAYTGITGTTTGNGTGLFSVAEGPTLFTGGTDEASGDSDDFNVRVVTVERLKSDWLFGIDLAATDILQVINQPETIEGVTVTKVSKGHPKGFGVLTYETHDDVVTNSTAAIGSGTNGTVNIVGAGTKVGSAGNGIVVNVVVPTGTSGLSATFAANTLTVNLAVISGVPNGAANTATLIAAAIDALPEFTATASGTGASAISGAATTMLTGGVTNTVRTMSWRGGPVISINKAGTFILPSGTAQGSPAASLLPTATQALQHYITIRVQSPALLPTTSYAENLLIDNKQMDDETLGRFLNEAISYLENDLLATYIEPTNVVTDRDPTTVQFAAGINAPTPLFTDPDYDYIVNPLTYFVPRDSAEWLKIQTPFTQVLRVDSLFGAIANTRVIDIDLQWIETSGPGGFIQLVPFNQEVAFDFVGLIWVNSIRGAVELPNFWHFNMIAGLRDCPAEVQEFIAKLAAINALTLAGLAFRPGLGSLSLGRDGVSESVSYNTAAQYGVYTGAIQSYKEWLETAEKKLRAKYRGLTMVVV